MRRLLEGVWSNLIILKKRDVYDILLFFAVAYLDY